MDLVHVFDAEIIRRELRQRHVTVEVLHDETHARPRGGERVRAEQPELEHQLRLLAGVLFQPRVHGVDDGAAARRPRATHPLDEHQQLAAGVVPHRPAPARHLEDEGAEREHVGGLGGFAKPGELRGEVAPGAGDVGGMRVGAVVVQPREAEVAQAAIHVGVEEHIAGLDVAVDDDLLPVVVQVEQTGRDALDDVKPLRPIQSPLARAMVVVVQEPVEAAIGHVIVDEEELAFVAAVAKEADEVAVAESAKGDDLGGELRHPLVGVSRGDHLHCENLVGKHPQVDSPEAAFPEQPVATKPIGGSPEILVMKTSRTQPVLPLTLSVILFFLGSVLAPFLVPDD